MASPVDAGRTPNEFTVATSPWVLSYPTPVAAGDLLVVFLRISAATITSLPTAFEVISGISNDATDASDDATSLWVAKADGGETGGQWSVSSAAKGAATVWRITGGADPSTRAPEANLAVGTGANCDPPSISPTGGSKDYLFLAIAGLDGETQTFTLPSTPSAFGNQVNANSGTGGAAATNVRTSGGSLAATASSMNPGTFTNAAPSNGWTALTVAIHPPASEVFGTKERYALDAVRHSNVW